MLRNTVYEFLSETLIWCGLFFGSMALPAHAVTFQWLRQLRTTAFSNEGHGVSTDGLGNVYISGLTQGSLGGPNAGYLDAFVAKYNASGSLQWIRQQGTSTNDYASGVSADALGNVFIAGSTGGGVSSPNIGPWDVFVTNYDPAGNHRWTKQLATSQDDIGRGVEADGMGNVYISGSTRGNLEGVNAGAEDAFLAKYDAEGSLQWVTQLGSSGSDTSNRVSADSLGNIYITGETTGSLGGPNFGNWDAFVAKYDSTGQLQWTKQLGTPGWDKSNDISADGLGNIYITGDTAGSLGGPNAGGPYDAFLAKYDAAGNLQWTKQLGTSAWDFGYGVTGDGIGNVYVTGTTEGSLGGPNVRGIDVFLMKFDPAGNLLWKTQFGTSQGETSSDISADEFGNVYFAGNIFTSGYSALLVKYLDVVPEPTAFAHGLLALAGFVLCHRDNKRFL